MLVRGLKMPEVVLGSKGYQRQDRNHCSCDYRVSAWKHPFTFRGPYFAIKVGESREYRYFSSIVDSALHFAFDYNVSYKQLHQLAVAVVAGTMLYQDIMQYDWNRGVAAHAGCNLRKCFDDPTTNAQEMLCAEIAEHDSSGYPHLEWTGNCMLHRAQSSGNFSYEGTDTKDVDLDLFSNDPISLSDMDGKKKNIFNCNKFYRAMYWIILVLNDAAKGKNGSDIMIAAEKAIHVLLKLKNIGPLKALLLSHLGLIFPMNTLYGMVVDKLLGPYKFIDQYHCSHQDLDPSAKHE
eukprot:scaffold65099_cov68-Attheya_sp.AAC.2